MSKKQQGAPTKTEPWTLFVGNKLQDGIAVLFFFSSFSFCAEAACQRWETFFNSQFFSFFYFENSWETSQSESAEFGALFSLLSPLFFPQQKSQREGPPPEEPPAWLEVFGMFSRWTVGTQLGVGSSGMCRLLRILLHFPSQLDFFPMQLITKCSLSFETC